MTWENIKGNKPEYMQLCEVELESGTKKLAKFTGGFLGTVFMDKSSIAPGFLISVQKWRPATDEIEQKYQQQLKETRQKLFGRQ